MLTPIVSCETLGFARRARFFGGNVMRSFLFGFAALALAVPAQAEWYRASSEHFLIYSEQKPDTLRQFAENLEKFDGAVRAVRRMDDLPLSQGNRVTIFVLRDAADVQ